MKNTKINLKQTRSLLISRPLIVLYSCLIAIFILDAFSGISDNTAFNMVRDAFLVFLLMIAIHGEYEKYEIQHRSSDDK